MTKAVAVAREHPERVEFFQVLRNRNFFAIWGAQIVSNLGDWLAVLALFSFLGFKLHASAKELAQMASIFLLPLALFLPIVGVLVDRLDLKKTMVWSDLARAVLVALLVFVVDPVQIYPIVFGVSVASCFFMSAQLAAVPSVVGKKELIVANSLSSQVLQLNAIVAPAIAGMIIAWMGEKTCFLLDSLSFLLSALCLSRVRISDRSPPSNSKELISPDGSRSSHARLRAMLADFTMGLRFVLENRLVTFVVVLAVATILAAGSTNALGVIYIRDVLSAGPGTLGTLLSSLGMGALTGVLLIGRFAQKVSRVRVVTGGVFTLGSGIFALTMISHLQGAAVCVFFLGLAAAAVLIPSQTLVQEQTPSAMLGRVGSASMSLMLTAQIMSIAFAGWAATWLGIKGLYRLTGLLLILAASLGLAYLKKSSADGATPPNR